MALANQIRISKLDLVDARTLPPGFAGTAADQSVGRDPKSIGRPPLWRSC
jgi:hypothetical protein